MARVAAMNIKKTLIIILIIVVSVLVVMAFYSNRERFSGLDTIRYMKISVNTTTSINELAEKYSDSQTKSKFVSLKCGFRDTLRAVESKQKTASPLLCA